MEALLNAILDEAEPKGQKQVMIFFKLFPREVAGALKRHATVPGAFELLSIGQTDQNSPPFYLSQYFMADMVDRIMVQRDDIKLPNIVSPQRSSGIIIPS